MRSSIFDKPEEIGERQRDIAREEGRGCQNCGTAIGVRRGRMKTMYHYEGEEGDEDDPNYATLCEPCWEECNAYWKERWDEYYSGLL
jgi:hypothetical protein